MTKPLKTKNQSNTKTKQEQNPLTDFEKGLLDELKSKGHAEELVDHYWGTINYVSSLIKARTKGRTYLIFLRYYSKLHLSKCSTCYAFCY